MLDKNEFKCDKCGRDDFDNKSNFTRHVPACKGAESKKRKKQSVPAPEKQRISNFLKSKKPRNDSHEISSIVEKLINDVCRIPVVYSQIETVDVDRIPAVDSQIEIDRDNTLIQIDSEGTREQQQSNTKCAGYRPIITQLYHNFPFQLLAEKNYLVFEAGVFHSKECYDLEYTLRQSDHNSNNSCTALKDDKFIKLYTGQSNGYSDKSKLNDKYLTYIQLTQRMQNIRATASKARLSMLNKNRSLQRLNKTVALHQRFILLIKDNAIHTLHKLVKVAVNRNRGINYITKQLVLASKGLYNPRSGEDDKDLSFMIL